MFRVRRKSGFKIPRTFKSDGVQICIPFKIETSWLEINRKSRLIPVLIKNSKRVHSDEGDQVQPHGTVGKKRKSMRESSIRAGLNRRGQVRRRKEVGEELEAPQTPFQGSFNGAFLLLLLIFF